MDTPEGTEPATPGGPKRRRRRRRGPRGSDSRPSDKLVESKPEGESKPAGEGKREAGRPGRNRRGRGGRMPSNRAAKVLAEQTEVVDLDKDIEQPLTEQEVAVLREHFRFLREYRKDLKLKVNANEDLLLNGTRVPDHRGVCHHLLAKVERKNVLAAAERLDPKRAAKLLAGIIRFSSDIEYVLLFLEKIQQSSSSAEATAALFQGLQRIEFEQVSNAQMRRVLQLMIELFDEKERPTLLLGMLESDGFRNAFDKSSEQLPEALSHLVLPLRAAQAVILHGEPNTFDSETLGDGVALLLELDSKILLRHSVEMRRRLFDLGLQACGVPHRFHDRLAMLLRNFPVDDSGRALRGIALARHLIGANDDAAAKQLLQTLARENPKNDQPARWLELLDAERLDRFVLLAQPAARTDALGQHTRRSGIWLENMQPVWVQIAQSDNVSTHESTLNLLREFAVPGLATVLESGSTEEGEGYFVVAKSGESLDQMLANESALGLSQVLRTCCEAVGILSALAATGALLPDVDPARFAIERSGALVLVDVAGAARVDADLHGGIHFDQARSFCTDLLNRVRRDIVPTEVKRALSDTKSCAELATALARHRA